MEETLVIPEHKRGTAALLVHLGRRMQLAVESAIVALGLRGRHLVAMTMLREYGDASQQTLVQSLQMDRTYVVGVLNELESEGLIERRRSPEDRRHHIVALTKLGAERLAQADAALVAAEDEVLAALSPDQRQTLLALLKDATSGHIITIDTDNAAPTN